MKNLKFRFKKLLNYGKALLLPLGMFLVIELVCSITIKRHLFETQLDTINFFRSCGVQIISAYALSINMSTGRMDLSLGGQKMVGCLIGGNLALSLGLGSWGVLLFGIVFGVVSGLVVGALFVALRMPSMILGIGMALLYESISVAYSHEGFQLFGIANMGLLSNAWFIAGIAAVCIFAMVLLLEHSKFGYHYNAIRGSQRVAIGSGVNTFGNAVVCYGICGGLIALAGVLETGYTGYMTTSLGLSSTTTAFTGFVPVFLAMFLQGICPMTIGIPIAVFTFRFLSMGLTLFSLPSAASTVISMGMLLVFLVVMSNLGTFKLNKALKRRGEAAMAPE